MVWRQGNLPDQLCHSGIGVARCNNNPGLNTGLVPNGTLNDSMSCNVWRSTSGSWALPPFSNWSDFNPTPALASSLPFKTGHKGERNILALIASQVSLSSCCLRALECLLVCALRYCAHAISAATDVSCLFGGPQPYEAFSSSVTLTLPTAAVLPTSKLYLLTANLAKSLKCYTPHAEITFGAQAYLT